MPKKIPARSSEFVPCTADRVFNARKRLFLSDTPRKRVLKTVMTSKTRAGIVLSGAIA
jgi:hypothetical protein